MGYKLTCSPTERHIGILLRKLLFAVVVFSAIIFFDLLNKFDPLGLQGYYSAGDSELTSARWAIRYVDFAHFGISINPFNSIIALCLFVLGIDCFSELLAIRKGSFADYFVSFLFLSNTFVGAILTYRYTSVAYAFAFLTSIICVKCIKMATEKQRLKKCSLLLLAVVCFTVTAGVYQTYVGCFAMAAVAVLIAMLVRGEDRKEIGSYFVCCLIVAIVGFVANLLILKIELLRFGTELSNYKGVDSFSISSVIKNLPTTIPKAYRCFIDYFLGRSFMWNIFLTYHASQGSQIFAKSVLLIEVAGFAAGVLYSCAVAFRKSKLNAALIGLLVALIPLIANYTMIIVPESGFEIQQTATEAFFPALLFGVVSVAMCTTGIFENKSEKKTWLSRAAKGATVAFVVLLTWGNITSTQIDQYVMDECMKSAESITQSVISDIVDMELYDSETPICVVGQLGGNEMFRGSPVYDVANEYVQFGRNNNGFTTVTFLGSANFRLGIDSTWEESDEFVNNPIVEQMPSYPAEGSIQKIDGKIVVKISDLMYPN